MNLGVPQNSVLVPLLFCLYIDVLKEHLDNSILKILYADDLQIYVQVPAHAIERGIDRLSQAAKSVPTCVGLNFLTLNGMKNKAIVFGSSHTIRLFKSSNILSIAINNLCERVQFVDESVILGVSLGALLDSTLSWGPINYIIKKVNRALFGLKFIRSFTTQGLRSASWNHSSYPILTNAV